MLEKQSSLPSGAIRANTSSSAVVLLALGNYQGSPYNDAHFKYCQK